MGNARVTYRPSPDATPEGEARARARAYRCVLRFGEQKREGACPGAPEDAKEPNSDRAKTSLQRRQPDETPEQLTHRSERPPPNADDPPLAVPG